MATTCKRSDSKWSEKSPKNFSDYFKNFWASYWTLMNLLKRNDAAGASTFPSYSVWQFPLRWNKYKTKKWFIEMLFYTSHHSRAKYQQKLPKLLWNSNTEAISLHYWDDLLLVTLESKNSLQLSNCRPTSGLSHLLCLYLGLWAF